MTRGAACQDQPVTAALCVDAGVQELNEMTIGRTDDPENPFRAAAFEAASLLGAGSRTPSGPADMAPRHKGRTHDRNRPARQISHFSLASKGPFSNRVSLVNSLLLSSVAAPGSRFSPRSEGSAATSGSKYKRCNVHNGLAWCRYVAQGPPAQPPAPSPRWATITPEATLRMDLSEGPARRPPADRTSGMARPSARCCA